VILDLIRSDLRALVLLLDKGLEVGGNLVGNVIDVSSALGGTNGIDERDLLETTVRGGDPDLPTIVHLFIGNGSLDVIKEFQVRLKALDWDLGTIQSDNKALTGAVGHATSNVVGTLGQ